MSLHSIMRSLAALMLFASLMACSPKKDEKPMRTMSQRQAEEQVRSYARTIAASLGSTAEQHETGVSATPCQGKQGELAEDGRFYVQGNYQIPLPATEHARVLAELRDHWQRQGYRIKAFTMFNEVEGRVSAENPSDEVQINVESAKPPTAMAVLLLTPCYMPSS